ncbi:MAG: hypothetical protein Q9227_006745 [Pyrenula ochraceoflavens]
MPKMNDQILPEDNATLPTIVDNRARAEPERLYGAITWIDDERKLKLREITYRVMSTAVDRCAHWLEERLGRSTDFRTLAYAGPSDLRYTIVTMAAAKTGHKALLLAPWNSKVAQLKLLSECDCHIFFVAQDDAKARASAEDISAQRKLSVHPFPSLSWVLDGPQVPFYPFQKTLDELRGEDYVIIHTSGSTGHPSPMAYKYGAMASLQWLVKPGNILPNSPTTNVKEMGGALGLNSFSIYFDMPMILVPPGQPTDVNTIFQILSEEICDAAILPPSSLQSLSRSPLQIDVVRRLKHILWVGAPWTSSEVADAIKSRTQIQPAYGSTEAGPFAFILNDSQEDYEWLQFHPIMGAELRHFAEDLCECVLVRDAKIEKAQFVFQNFPHLREWRTKDLFSRHPSRPDLWRFRGRRDDMIVLSNGRNVDPSLMESIVTGHLKVKAALLSGNGRTALALLVEVSEPPSSEQEKQNLLEEILPTVQKGNELSKSYARVKADMIVLSKKEKPFPRAGKGSVQRQMALDEYKLELNWLYDEGPGKDLIMD